jgi:hypothetical protein
MLTPPLCHGPLHGLDRMQAPPSQIRVEAMILRVAHNPAIVQLAPRLHRPRALIRSTNRDLGAFSSTSSAFSTSSTSSAGHSCSRSKIRPPSKAPCTALRAASIMHEAVDPLDWAPRLSWKTNSVCAIIALSILGLLNAAGCIRPHVLALPLLTLFFFGIRYIVIERAYSAHQKASGREIGIDQDSRFGSFEGGFDVHFVARAPPTLPSGPLPCIHMYHG